MTLCLSFLISSMRVLRFHRYCSSFKLDDSHEANNHKSKMNPSYSEISSLFTNKSSLEGGQGGSYCYHISRLHLLWLCLFEHKIQTIYHSNSDRIFFQQGYVLMQFFSPSRLQIYNYCVLLFLSCACLFLIRLQCVIELSNELLLCLHAYQLKKNVK